MLIPSRNELDFQPTDDISSILAALRSSSLGWIADEMDQAIRGGRPDKNIRELHSMARASYSMVPFSGSEQLGIVIKTLRNYFVVLPHVWDEANANLRESLGQLELSVSLPETEERLDPFAPDYLRQAHHFYELLLEAWPDGIGQFEDDGANDISAGE